MNAKEMIMKRSAAGKAFTLAALAVLALGLAPLAKAERKPCTAATLKGTFADKETGFITSPPAMAGPMGGVNIETFDGKGGLTGSGMVSVNGNIFSGTFEGTYTVNSDCTGTYTVQNSSGLTIHAFFVIADGGNEFHDVITDPGTVINCYARRIFPQGDSLD